MPIRPASTQAVADYEIDIDNAKAEVDRAQAAVEDAEINLGYCKMYAPIDGRIGELKVKVGNLVGDAGLTELVTIEQLDPMGLDLRPPARYLPEATALLGDGSRGQPDRRRRATPSARRQGDLHRQQRRRADLDIPASRGGREPRRARSCPANTSRPP